MNAGVAPISVIGLLIWIFFWKGLALWKAANQGQKNWFIAMLILNAYTYGIVEIAYLFYFSKKRMTVEELKKILFVWKH